MATRSAILIERKGKFHGIYCHNDGYPEWNGNILLKHFKNARRVKQLIKFGETSSLRRLIHSRSKPHDFHNKKKNVSVFYHRDRDEEFRDMKNLKSINDVDKYYYGLEYIYVFKNNKWYFSNGNIYGLSDLESYLKGLKSFKKE